MHTLLDPTFKSPDLVALAKAMAARTISTSDACALARRVTGGEVRETSVGRALVVGPIAGATKALENLQAYANAQDQESVERWAAFALMIEAQLGGGDLDPGAASIGLSNALRGFEPCLRATHGRCPPEAGEFAIHMVESILKNPACTDPDLRKRLMAARDSFRECGEMAARIPSEEAAEDARNASRTVILWEDTDAAVIQFVKADGVGELYSSLRHNPELLSDGALEEMRRVMDYQIHDAAKRKLAERAALLRRCRAVGVDQVFRELFRPEASNDHSTPATESDK
jgi:hypothetical protein